MANCFTLGQSLRVAGLTCFTRFTLSIKNIQIKLSISVCCLASKVIVVAKGIKIRT
jgi:hypothetical protein